MAQILLEIQTNDNENIIERRFASNMVIADLKNRLELLTGASAATMELTFRDISGNLIGNAEDSKCLNDYLQAGGEAILRLQVKDSNAVKLDDLSNVPKYEMNDEDYAKRGESLRAFKMKHKLGRFANGSDDGNNDEEAIKNIKVGDRCEVTIANIPKRGQVMYVGQLGSKPGLFVGVRYDEPYGKNDGTFENVRYFECKPNYGSFVKPKFVKVGDYPEIEVNFND